MMRVSPESSWGKRSFLLLFFCAILINWFSGCTQSPIGIRGRSPQTVPFLPSEMEQEYQRAERLFQQGKYGLALQAFSDFREHFPQSPFDGQALQKLARIHFIQRNYSVAIDYFEMVITEYPDFSGMPQVLLSLAYSYFYLPDMKKTASVMGEIKVDELEYEEKKEFIYLQALMASKEKDHPLAFEKLVSLIKDPPSGIREEHLKKEIQDIIFYFLTSEQLKDLIANYPTEFPGSLIRWQLANHLKASGKTEEARKLLTELIVSYPGSEWAPKAKSMLSELISATGVQTKAINYNKIPGGKPPVIGAILPLSGENSHLGVSALNGIELAYTGGIWATTGDIQLIIKDDQSSPQKAFEAFRELARNERVLAIIGPAYRDSAREISRLAQNLRLPTFSPDSESLDLSYAGSYFFRNTLTDIEEARSLAHYTYATLDIRYLAIAFPNDPLGIELKNYFSQEFQEKGGQIMVSYPYSPDTVDFSKMIADLTSQGLNFQALFIPDTFQAGVMIASQLAFSDLTRIQLIGTSLWDFPEFLDYGGASIDGAIFSSEFYPQSVLPQVQRFVLSYQSQFQRLPDALASRSYDIANILLEIISEGARAREEVKEKLLQVRNYHGVSRLTSMAVNGDAVQDLIILRVEGSNLIQLQ